MYYFIRGIFWIFLTLFHRIRIEGLENVPKTGPLLMLANHPSMMDMFMTAYRMPRKVHFMAKAELFSSPLKNWFFTSIGAFPVHRGKGDIASVRTAIRLIQEGNMVAIFPEGTRTRERSKTRKKGGAALIAVNSGAPILPVGIQGRYRFLGSVRIVIGKPFMLDPKLLDVASGAHAEHADGSASAHPAREALIEANEIIMDRIYGLIGG